MKVRANEPMKHVEVYAIALISETIINMKIAIFFVRNHPDTAILASKSIGKQP